MSLCSRKHCAQRSAPGSTRCVEHERQRIRTTRWAARRREAQLAEQWRTAATCPRKQGVGVCGGRIRTEIGRHGQSVLVCEFCERRKQGRCRDCSAPVHGQRGKSIRCKEHAREAVRESIRAYTERHHDAVLARARDYYQSDAEVRKRRNDYKRAYRKAHPDKVRAQKLRYVARHRADPNSRYNRYHQRYRVKYRAQKRELERDRLQVARPPKKTAPTCTRCGKSTRWRPVHKGHAGRPWTVCTKCLFPSERKIRLRHRRRALARAKAWLESIPTPARIRRPPAAAVRGPGWERVCVTPGCDIVVTHRKKKCSKCKRRDEELARQLLEAHRGRGRRTDRELVA